eukprot:3625648-Rhodomonas_salina.1
MSQRPLALSNQIQTFRHRRHTSPVLKMTLLAWVRHLPRPARCCAQALRTHAGQVLKGPSHFRISYGKERAMARKKMQLDERLDAGNVCPETCKI